MPNAQEKLLNGAEPVLLEASAEERLRAEIEQLRRDLENERKRNGHGAQHGQDSAGPRRPTRRSLWLIGLALAVVLLLAFFLGWLPHTRREKQLQNEAKREAQALPRVNYIKVERSGTEDDLLLPGNTEALTDAPILARSDGYVVSRIVDIGDRVKKGQLMAVIAAPDVDQQVRQARAQVMQAEAALRQASANEAQGQANTELARVTAARYAALVQRGAVARQDYDTEQATFEAQRSNLGALTEAVAAAKDNVESARANLARLVELQSFEKVTAPFDGIVTLRNIDTGALITSGTTLLFRVAQIGRLRTYVNVPQPNAPTVKPGQAADLLVVEYRDRRFPGVVTRMAGALDPSTRTMLTEVQVPNPDGVLRPGMYVQVRLRSQRTDPPILIPGDALITHSDGLLVALLNLAAKDNRNGPDQGTIHLQPVTVGRDYGNATEIYTGLNAGDKIVVNPNDDVREGAKVQGTLTKAQLDVQNASSRGAKQNANAEQKAPAPGAEPNPAQPSKTDKKRGPGY